jgi:hypothetical protein
VIIFESFTIQTDASKRKGLQTRKVKDRICVAERRFVQSGDKTKTSLFYFIGNQSRRLVLVGFYQGVFSRRGGKWGSRQTHSRYTTVGIVDLSDMYVLLFSSISNRGRTVNGSS